MTTKDIVPVLQKEISPITVRANTLSIIDEASMTEGVELLSVLNKKNDLITDEKEKITKPLNQALKVERARWKPLEDVLEGAIGIVRRKMTVFQTEAKRKADEEEAKIAARVGEGRGKLKAETAVAKINEIDKPSKQVSADAGIVKFKTVKKFEVVDMAALPIEYHLADEVAIRKAMLAGQELAGVRYFTEQIPSNSR